MSDKLSQQKHFDSNENDENINSEVKSGAVSLSQKRVHRRDKKISEKTGERKRERGFGIKKIEFLTVTYHIMEYQIDHLIF